MAALFTFTTFLAALLLFSVQPLVTRLMLPSLGGSPSVWNTAMVFFQAVLLAGYGYAHYLGKGFLRRPKVALLAHGLVLLLPLICLPLALPAGATPPATAQPILWLLGLLALCVGLPFFVISTSSPLLQRTFALTPHRAAKDPYFLYAASNAGSLIALLSYPILIEPNWPLSLQSRIWACGYLILIPCLWACLFAASKSAVPATTGAEVAPAPPISWKRRGRWILLAFAPSSLMLSVTTYLSTDVVAIPLMWILPLSLYLLSFMVVFAGRQWIPPMIWARGLAMLLILLVIVLAGHATDPLKFLVPLHLFIFFVAAVVCHGEMARDRPEPVRLTEFYAWMAFGGVLGGAFNALLAPLLFKSVAEYGLTVVLICLLLPRELLLDKGNRDRPAPKFSPLDFAPAIGIGALAFGLIALFQTEDVENILRGAHLLTSPLPLAIMIGLPALLCFPFSRHPPRFGLALGAVLLAGTTNRGAQDLVVEDAERSFFGIHRVIYQPHLDQMTLVHGATIHGVQFVGKRKPISYYSERGPAGDMISAARVAHARLRPDKPFRVAAVGLGCGVLASYIRAGEDWTFYEIDPAVAGIAQNPKFFTYWSGAPTPPHLELGDARLRLKTAPAQNFDLIMLDAYSSDTIPVHLVTREALALYRSKLADGGLIGWHLSNEYFDLEPVVARLALDCGWTSRIRHDFKLPKEVRDQGISPSRWACVAARPEDLDAIASKPAWVQPRLNAPLWTDDYSSLWAVLWRPANLKKPLRATVQRQ